MPVNEQSDCEAIKGARSARLRIGHLLKVNLTAESQIDLKFLMIWFILVSVFGFQGTNNLIYGSVVKRLRHRPFTAVTRVQFPSESFNPR